MSKKKHARANGRPDQLALSLNPDGWFSMREPAAGMSECELLAAHADWRGPVKLTREHSQVWREWSACVRSGMQWNTVSASDPEAQTAEQRLLAKLARLAADRSADSTAEWEPPDAMALVGWLAEAGRDSQIDSAGNLRLVVKRRGCDGQIRLERGVGRLRFVLPIGSWSALPAESQGALCELADEANSRTVLARVAWFDDGHSCRCEGQVDLTGLPVPNADRPERVGLWRLMTGLAVDGLEILLRRLGLEMDVLADDRQRAVKEMMHDARTVRA